MAYGDFKDLPRKTASDKAIRDKAFDIAKIQNRMDINAYLLQWFIIFFHRKSSNNAVKSQIMLNQELAKELRKPIMRKFEKRKAHSLFKDSIWGADLADMHLTIKFNRGMRFLLCLIDFYRKKKCMDCSFKR